MVPDNFYSKITGSDPADASPVSDEDIAKVITRNRITIVGKKTLP